MALIWFDICILCCYNSVSMLIRPEGGLIHPRE